MSDITPTNGSCGLCKWSATTNLPNGILQCRRNPPQCVGPNAWAFPLVGPDNWCGEWKLGLAQHVPGSVTPARMA